MKPIYLSCVAATILLLNSTSANAVNAAKKPEPIKLKTVTVEGEKKEIYSIPIYGKKNDNKDIDGYRAINASSATKTSTPIQQIPQSIQVVPLSVIEDQQNRSIADTLLNVSGVTTVGSLEEVNGTETIRGFQARQYVDGMQSYYGFSEPDSLVNVERVEVVKGPTSTLYTGGVGSADGGMINLVSKKPFETPEYSFTSTAGSFSTFGQTFDVNQPLDKQGKMLFRMTGEYLTNESWIKGAESEKRSLFPTLQFNFNEDTSLVLRGQFNDRNQTDYSGLPNQGTVTPASFVLDRDLFVYSDNQPDTESQSSGIAANFKHKIDDVFTANVDMRYLVSNFNQYSFFPFPASPAFGSTYNITSGYLGQDINAFTFSPNLAAEFETGAVEHKVVGGLDHDSTEEWGRLDISSDVNLVDLTNYTAQTYNFNLDTPFSIRDTQFKTTALYLQDQMTINERLHILGGLRWTRLNVHDKDAALFLDTDSTNYHITPKAGISYDLTKSLTLFTGYGEGFNSVLGFSGNAPVKPQTSQQLEGGVKFNFADVGLSGTWAVFETTRQNVPTTDPNNAFLQVQTGEQRVRGTELDTVLQINPALSFIANYAYQNAEMVKDTNIAAGNKLVGIPEHSGRLATRYNFQDAKLEGLGVGAGITAATGRMGNSSNSFDTPGFYNVDAQVSYDTGRLIYKLSGYNLTNEEYYEPYTFLGGAVIPNQPAAVYFSITAKFN